MGELLTMLICAREVSGANIQANNKQSAERERKAAKGDWLLDVK
jgi:hypothetical protein